MGEKCECYAVTVHILFDNGLLVRETIVRPLKGRKFKVEIAVSWFQTGSYLYKQFN